MAARDLASFGTAGHDAGAALAARYRSLFVIGRGGMGAVEAALELHGGEARESNEQTAYERVVALKRLLPDAARDKRRVDMFLREAKLAKLLDHPNVVRAYDYGEIDGELFLAMEYVEGQPLSRVLKALADGKGELGASLTAHVLAEVCEGLHAAHELRDAEGQPLNLVHRDVSPQNVMAGYDGHVRLLDFGVAKIEAESVTKTGEVKGKTAYMSPEQAMGDAIDRRSDLFGVGAVLFECLALRRMWGDGTDMDVIRKLALEQPPRLEDAVASAPAELCALYTRLVARDAGARPADAHAVAEELRKLVPQGREEATRALRKLLDTHFREQAEEQRRRLTSSLEEVAPAQARELRESVLPETATPPSTPSLPALPRGRASTSSVADATGANPSSAASEPSAGVAATNRSSTPWPWLVAGALVVMAFAVWRLATSSAATPMPPAPMPPATASITTAAITTATATAPATAIAPATATAIAPTAPTAPTAATAATPPATASATARAAGSPRLAASTITTAAPRPSARPATSPAASAPKPPPDVDDHPF